MVDVRDLNLKCADCDTPLTELPFKPAEGRPVYCRVCARKRKLAAEERGNQRGGGNRPPHQSGEVRNPNRGRPAGNSRGGGGFDKDKDADNGNQNRNRQARGKRPSGGGGRGRPGGGRKKLEFWEQPVDKDKGRNKRKSGKSSKKKSSSISEYDERGSRRKNNDDIYDEWEDKGEW